MIRKERKCKVFCVFELYLRGEGESVKKMRGRFDSEIFLPLLDGKGKENELKLKN